jgi:hypothetical protein
LVMVLLRRVDCVMGFNVIVDNRIAGVEVAAGTSHAKTG